jgi:hypothetical protein
MKKYLLGLLMLCILSSASAVPQINLSQRDSLKIGQKIWQNEARGNAAWLTWWNKGEDFASMGIGHFIWYPNGVNGVFFEMFPQFLQYAQDHGAKVPSWLRGGPACPWNTREAFMDAQYSPRMIELRKFLASTVDLQTQFIIKDLNQAIPSILATVTGKQREHVEEQLEIMLATQGGNYAVIDYTNFKGLGIYPKERYKGQGWGLLQVLEKMQAKSSGPAALQAFTDAAQAVLQQRVANAPVEHRETRWLPGWLNRVETYRYAD